MTWMENNCSSSWVFVLWHDCLTVREGGSQTVEQYCSIYYSVCLVTWWHCLFVWIQHCVSSKIGGIEKEDMLSMIVVLYFKRCLCLWWEHHAGRDRKSIPLWVMGQVEIDDGAVRRWDIVSWFPQLFPQCV